jgi:hypothetical protein
MSKQPGPPQTRQSGPQAKPASKDELHKLKPGGPIMPAKQGFVNPGPTDNLRGVEHNTNFHKGEPNPEQHGSHGPIGDYVHNPGMGQAGDVHRPGVPVVTADVSAKHSAKGTKVAPPMPNPRGVRK